MLTELLQKQKYFVIPFVLLALASLYIITTNNQSDLHLSINAYHSPFFDGLMPYLTHLGDGVFTIICIVALLFVKYRFALQTLASYLVSSIITQIGKNYFAQARPIEFFGENAQMLHLIEGIEMHRFNSFPSGHATTAFALFFTLSILFNKSKSAFLFFLMASISAFSRVYLSLHFLQDILAGAIIGSISALLIAIWFSKSKYLQSEKLDKKLFG